MSDNWIRQEWPFQGGKVVFEVRSERPVTRDEVVRFGDVCVEIKLFAMTMDATPLDMSGGVARVVSTSDGGQADGQKTHRTH